MPERVETQHILNRLFSVKNQFGWRTRSRRGRWRQVGRAEQSTAVAGGPVLRWRSQDEMIAGRKPQVTPVRMPEVLIKWLISLAVSVVRAAQCSFT